MNNELTFEQVQAEYFDEDALKEPTEPLYRVDGSGNRYYYKMINGEPEFFISVTSLIGATMKKGFGFQKWLKENTPEQSEYTKNSRAAFGTLMHIWIAKYIISGKVNLDELHFGVEVYAEREGYPELAEQWTKELSKALLSFAVFMEERNVTPLAVEIGLSDRFTGMAGCIDLVCELDWNGGRKTSIIDMKSGSFWPSHPVQLESYKRLWEKKYPDDEIDMLFNWSGKDWRSKPTYKLKNQTKSKHRDKLDHLLKIWEIDHSVNDPGSITTFQGMLESGEDISENYTKRSISEMVTERHKDNS